MLKKTFAALSLLCIFAACQNDENSTPQPQPRKDITLTRAEQEMLDKGNDFAFRFFNQVCKTENEKPNLFVSPLSATLCLSMVANGAAGNTLEEMKTALGFSDYSLEEMNNYNQKLVSALLDLDNTTRLGIANSIWIKRGFGVHDDFVNVNKKIYDAQVQELDFSSPKAVDIINNW
ncbi:serpin family protein, partial [Bacteroides heparinolyticus]